MTRQNYSHGKRQRELGKQNKRKEKEQRRAERKASGTEAPDLNDPNAVIEAAEEGAESIPES